MQANSNASTIVRNNDECSSYVPYYYTPTASTLSLFKNNGSVKDDSGNNVSLTTYGTIERKDTGYKGCKYLQTNGSCGFYGDVDSRYSSSQKTLSTWLLCGNTSGWREAFAIGNGANNGTVNLGKSSTYTDGWTGFRNTSWNDVFSRVTMNTTTWMHICFVINGTSYAMYINGVKTNTGSITGVSYNSVVQVGGRNKGSNSENWIGGIGECIYENSVWTDSQVLDYYNKSKGNYNG